MTVFEQALQKAYEAISAALAEKGRIIVAIDGRCASGKSSLAQELAAVLGANLIHMDDFFLRPHQRSRERLAIPGENIDHERFLTEVLLPLREGRAFSYRPFSCSTQRLGDPVSVIPKPVTLIEGSYACHMKLRDHYDLRIFLTVDPTEQMQRIEARNGSYVTAFLDTWIPLEEAYFRFCSVADCCHLVLDTTMES